jgi:hypothetical protein
VALAMVPSIGFLRGEKFHPVHAFYTITTPRYANVCAKKIFTTFAANSISDSRAPTLAATCIHPGTRKTRIVSVEEAQLTSEVLGGA